ncbi:MAG TPA: hypothetical protein VFM39_07085 [bacterium]|nr:hypothetical protein [bacterium]
MQINWKRAIVAGIVGTVAFDVLGLILTGQWWDLPALLGMKTGLGFLGGLVGHYANGVVLAVIYAALAPSLWGSGWVRALTYVTLETVFAVWLTLFPLLGVGVAGIGAGPFMPIIALARHWAYGLALAWLYPLGAGTGSGDLVRAAFARADER